MAGALAFSGELDCCNGPISDLSLDGQQAVASSAASKLLELNQEQTTADLPELPQQLSLDSEEAALHSRLLHDVVIDPRVQKLLGRLVAVGDISTRDHGYRVGSLMIAGAIRFGVSEAKMRLAGRVGILHDVGKAVPTVQQAINTPRRMDNGLLTVIRTHPWHGVVMARRAGLGGNEQQAIGNHHTLQTIRPYGVFRPDSLVPVAEADGSRPDLRRLIGLLACCDHLDAVTVDANLRRRKYQLDGAEPYDRNHVIRVLDTLHTDNDIKDVVLGIAA